MMHRGWQHWHRSHVCMEDIMSALRQLVEEGHVPPLRPSIQRFLSIANTSSHAVLNDQQDCIDTASCMQLLLRGAAAFLSNAACALHGLGLTSRQQADVSEEGVVDLKGIEGIQASMIYGGHQDVLLALAAAAPCTLTMYVT